MKKVFLITFLLLALTACSSELTNTPDEVDCVVDTVNVYVPLGTWWPGDRTYVFTDTHNASFAELIIEFPNGDTEFVIIRPNLGHFTPLELTEEGTYTITLYAEGAGSLCVAETEVEVTEVYFPEPDEPAPFPGCFPVFMIWQPEAVFSGEKLRSTANVVNVGDGDCTGGGFEVSAVLSPHFNYHFAEVFGNSDIRFYTETTESGLTRVVFNFNVLSPGEEGEVDIYGVSNSIGKNVCIDWYWRADQFDYNFWNYTETACTVVTNPYDSSPE